MEKTINMATDFSKSPAGRYRDYAKYSGEAFREDYLLPALKDTKIENLIINLNDLEGVGSSFWDEAFGIIARKNKKLYKKIHLKCDDDDTLIPTIKKITEGK